MEADSNVEQTTEVVTQNEAATPQTEETTTTTENTESAPLTLDDALAKALKPEAEAPATTEPQATEKPVVEALQPKEHWEKSEKDIFAKLPDDETKKAFLEIRRKADQKITENAQAKSALDNFVSKIKPFGVDSPEKLLPMVEYYSRVEADYQKNPMAVIEFLASQKGIDLKKHYSGQQQVQQPADDEWVDPRTAQLEKTVEELKAERQRELQAREQEIKNAVNKEITEFSQTKDDSGNLKFPHFERLRGEMSLLLNAGKAQTMEDAYNLAMRLDPELYQQQLEQKIKAEREAEEAARREEVKKATTAGRHLSGTGAARAAPKIRTLDDALSVALNS